MREIAEVIGRGVEDSRRFYCAPEQVSGSFRVARRCLPGTTCLHRATKTQKQLGWSPTGPGLIADLERMDYSKSGARFVVTGWIVRPSDNIVTNSAILRARSGPLMASRRCRIAYSTLSAERNAKTPSRAVPHPAPRARSSGTSAVRGEEYAASQRPSAFAPSTSIIPGGSMRPDAMSASAFATLIFDQRLFRRRGRESLQIKRLVQTRRLPIDPSETQRFFHRLGIRHRLDAAAFLRELDPGSPRSAHDSSRATSTTPHPSETGGPVRPCASRV